MPSRALLTEVQTISNAEIVQALANLKIVATSGITSTFPATASTLAGLSVANTFTANQAFSGTISLVATTATAGKIIQAGNNLLHTFGTENLFLGLNAGNTTGSGQYSVGVGTRTMFSLTTGRQNLCFGWQAGYYITTGWDNMIFGGYNTGHGISTGSGNTIIGASADATNGNYRGAIGAGASCTADDTIVIGKAAGTYSVAGTPGSRSADAIIIRGTTTCTGGVIFGTYTVSNFPQTTYLEAVVTDALSPVVGSTVNAGGSAKCKVMYNGSAKIVTAVL